MHGRTVPLVLLFCLAIAVLIVGTLFNSPDAKYDQARADSATTSVTVLNTAPVWTVDAEESVVSSTSAPTNTGTNTIWVATGTDSSGDAYFLLICKTSGSPTANAGAPPTCSGGASNQWAISATTTSASQANATRTALEADGESNAWFAWICDANISGAFCNGAFKQGNGNFDKSSPFYVNHRPIFTLFADTSPTDPGLSVTWTASSVDYDTSSSTDDVRLFVCRSNDFTGSACGGAGTFCVSGLYTSTPTCTFTVSSVLADANYASYGYIIDGHGHAATGGAQNTDSILTINNVTSTITAASVSLNDTDGVGGLTLTAPSATTFGFTVKYTVADNNSCLTSGSTDEIINGRINVYRASITQAGCKEATNFNANNCYPGVSTGSRWTVNYAQDPNTCSGVNDNTAAWTATFSLWYVADPTDGTTASDSPYFADNWLASVYAEDDDRVTSTLVEVAAGNEVISFLAISLLTNTINYGSLTPGTQNDPLTITTTLAATGNVGIDEILLGSAMCTTYPSCSGDATDTIHVANQKVTTSSNPYSTYANGKTMTSTSTDQVETNGYKSTNTSTQASTSTWWGVRVPSSITKSGSYTGVNTIIGVKSEGTEW